MAYTDLMSDLANHLIENGVGTAIDTDIFIDFEPEQENFIAITETSGLASFSYSEAVTRTAQIKVMNSPLVSFETIWKIYNILLVDIEEEVQTTSGGRYFIIQALQPPSKLGRLNENGLQAYVFNILITSMVETEI